MYERIALKRPGGLSALLFVVLLGASSAAAQSTDAVGRVVEVNGIDMYYEATGEGEPVVLLHGFNNSGTTWAGIAPELAKAYQVIVPDLRGHGRSTNPSKQFTHRQSALAVSCLYGLFSRPQHVVTTAHGSRRPGLLECGDRSSEAFPYRGRAMFERRPSVAADDCAETQTHPGRPAVAPY